MSGNPSESSKSSPKKGYQANPVGLQSLYYSTGIRFLKGGLSGFASGALLQPLQVIKTSMQIRPINQQPTDHAPKNLSFMQATRTIYTSEGLPGFMRGLFPSLLKSTLNSATYFSTLYYFEEMLKSMHVMKDAQVHMAASSMARVLQSVISNPIIVIKTRLEVIGFNEYSSTYDACKKIVRNEGYGGFFTGLKVSLIRDVPFSGIFYPIYSFFKKELLQLYELKNGVGSTQQLSGADRVQLLAVISSIASFSANIASCTITHPIDLIRTRIFFQHYNKDKN